LYWRPELKLTVGQRQAKCLQESRPQICCLMEAIQWRVGRFQVSEIFLPEVVIIGLPTASTVMLSQVPQGTATANQHPVDVGRKLGVFPHMIPRGCFSGILIKGFLSVPITDLGLIAETMRSTIFCTFDWPLKFHIMALNLLNFKYRNDKSYLPSCGLYLPSSQLYRPGTWVTTVRRHG